MTTGSAIKTPSWPSGEHDRRDVAFGMGIDKSNVRYVVHAGMPKSLEHYQQESGRAGRDGVESECWLLHSGRDAMTWKRMLQELPAKRNSRAPRSKK